MKWLLGLGLVLVALILLGIWARSSWRRGVRRQVLDELREHHPEITLLKETEASLELRLADGAPGTLILLNLYAGLAMGPRDPAVQQEAVRAFVGGALSSLQEANQPLSLAQHGERLMPRLADAGFGREAAAKGKPLVERPASIPGLVVLYVLDSEQNVMFLGEERLTELGLDASALHERAMANLRRKPIAEIVRGVVARKEVAMVKLGDTYDATRLLLVPETLADGEELVAVIPDRETLGLFPVPSAEAWPQVRKLAGMPASPYRLLDRPLRVTRDGFALA
jgi:uncharacterized protein YtpQ (UPF0354 family)